MAFDYAKAYQQLIDEELAATSATAWMIPEADKIRFTSGRDIEISTLYTTGLGDYDAIKADGSAYSQRTVTNSWTNYTLSMSRGVKFSLNRTNPNDAGFIVTAENVIREFTRNALVKEQDNYRINRLYALADGDADHKASHSCLRQHRPLRRLVWTGKRHSAGKGAAFGKGKRGCGYRGGGAGRQDSRPVCH